MELEPSDWISIVSLLVNVVLLIVTMREVRSAWAAHSKQMRQQFFTDYTKRYQEIIRNFPEDVNEPDFQLNQNRGTERGDDFRQAWARITRPHDTNYGDAFKAFVDRLMDPARSIPR